MTRMIIPAAGRGTRLQANVPKLLFEVDGKSLIQHVMSCHAPHVDGFIVVIHPDMERAVRDHLEQTQWPCQLAFQESATGMLDAILLAADCVRSHDDPNISISWCDQIGISAKTSAQLHHEVMQLDQYGMVVPTVTKPDPYIHLERDAHGAVSRILQRREGDVMPNIGENDCGLFALTRATYLEWLPEYAKNVTGGSATQERNFLPFIPWLARRAKVRTFSVENINESVGINTRDEARKLSEELPEQ